MFTFPWMLLKGFRNQKIPKAKIRKGVPTTCLLGFHDESTNSFYISVDNHPINRFVCKNCREYILPESWLEYEKLSSQSGVKVLKTEFYSHTSTVTKTKWSSISKPPEKLDEVEELEYEEITCEGYKVLSVKRLSDGEIFSIGDKVQMKDEANTWEISMFTLNNAEVDKEYEHCSVGFTHTTCYVISLGLLTKIKN